MSEQTHASAARFRPLNPAVGWARYGSIALWLVVAHAVLTAILRLLPAFEALVLVPDAAIDLLIRYHEVHRWFAGTPIYADAHSANYPPGSYTLLWPLLGWLAETPMRVLYAHSVLAACAAISVVAGRASGAVRMPERMFMLVFILPLGATMITVWIGQLGLHVTAALLGAAWLLVGAGRDRNTAEQSRSWKRDAAAAALLTFSLVKPTLSLPLLIAILIVAGGRRPAALTAMLYIAVTLIASAAQAKSPVTLAQQWFSREEIMNLPLGSVNVYLWLHWLGVEGSMIPASLAILAGAIAWVWLHRASPPWPLIGAAALVARLWIHHRAFDDVLLIIPAVALFQIAKTGSTDERRVSIMAALLLALMYVFGLAPYTYLSGEHPGLWLLTEAGRTFVWLSTLAFLIWRVHRSTRAEFVVYHP